MASRSKLILFPLIFGLIATVFVTSSSGQEPRKSATKLQFSSPGIAIPAATADEPLVKNFNADSVAAAAHYLDEGALAWTRERSCISCHTTGVYMAERTVLTPFLGRPNEEVRKVFLKSVPTQVPKPGAHHGQKSYNDVIFVVWRTLGLAQWDRHVTGQLSEETAKSLEGLLLRQADNGLWTVASPVEVPYITTDFEFGVEAARAIQAAPGWLESLKDAELLKRVDRMKTALRTHTPRNDYERVLKLQLAAVMPEAVARKDIDEALGILTRLQKPDGSWSLRNMSTSANWGDTITPDNIALIDGLADAADPAGDPYMTAFAIVLMREVGIPKTDPRIQKGVAWLKANQRVGGRWWMNSLYKNTYHYITYIATCQALRALALCDELPKAPTATTTAAAP